MTKRLITRTVVDATGGVGNYGEIEFDEDETDPLFLHKDGTFQAQVGGTLGGLLADDDYGDITVSSSGTVMTVDDNVVTYAKMQNVSATDKVLGRVSSGAGDVEEIPCTPFARSLLDDVDAATARATLGVSTGVGTVTSVTGQTGILSVADPMGDAVITLDDDGVTNAKLANMADGRIKGNNTGAPANPVDLTVAQVKTMLGLATVPGTVISVTGTAPINVANGATAQDRVVSLNDAGVTTIKIADQNVTRAKLEAMDEETLMGRGIGSGAGDPQALENDGTLIFTDDTVGRAAISGDVVINDGSNNAAIQDDVITTAMLQDEAVTTAKIDKYNVTGGIDGSLQGTTVEYMNMASDAVYGHVLADAGITNAKFQDMPTMTVKANITGGDAPPDDVPIADLLSAISSPSRLLTYTQDFLETNENGFILTDTPGPGGTTDCYQDGGTTDHWGVMYVSASTAGAIVTIAASYYEIFIGGSDAVFEGVLTVGYGGAGTSRIFAGWITDTGHTATRSELYFKVEIDAATDTFSCYMCKRESGTETATFLRTLSADTYYLLSIRYNADADEAVFYVNDVEQDTISSAGLATYTGLGARVHKLTSTGEHYMRLDLLHTELHVPAGRFD